MLKINHFTHRLKTNTKKDAIEFTYLNLIFEVDKENFDLFKYKADDWKKTYTITDKEEYDQILDGDWLEKETNENGHVIINFPDTSHLRQEGWTLDNPILRYNEKFNVFVYREYFTWMPAVEGLIQQIKLLQLGVNNSRTTDEYLLLQILNALDNFWD